MSSKGLFPRYRNDHPWHAERVRNASFATFLGIAVAGTLHALAPPSGFLGFAGLGAYFLWRGVVPLFGFLHIFHLRGLPARFLGAAILAASLYAFFREGYAGAA